MIIGNKLFDTQNKTYIMGILNVTPDSFSDGGSYYAIDDALKRAETMITEGAHILDIGGESTRPGYLPVSIEEEISRTAPVIEKIKSCFDIPVSIDTYKSKVAEAALRAGADLVNDIWGLKNDSGMAAVIKEHNASCCLMHNRAESNYQNFQKDFLADMQACISLAKRAGIADEQIMLDPGVGFAKSYEQNLEVIRLLPELKKLGYPILLGTSRKSVIGLTLNLPASQRLEGTLATTVYGMLHGCSFVRVHDIEANKRVIQMITAIQNKE